MTQHLNTFASSAAAVGLFGLGCLFAGLGLFVAVLLALFALAATGLGILAAPLIALCQPPRREAARRTSAARFAPAGG